MARRAGSQGGQYRVVVALLLLATALLGVACRSQAAAAADMRVALTVSPEPPVVGPAVVTVQITDAGGWPLAGAEVEVEGNMAHAGMVPVLAQAAERESGLYVTDRFRFTMRGDWFLTVRATLPGGRHLEKVFDVKGVGGNRATPDERSHGTGR